MPHFLMRSSLPTEAGKMPVVSPGLVPGVNIVDGKIVFKAVAEAWDKPYTPLEL